MLPFGDIPPRLHVRRRTCCIGGYRRRAGARGGASRDPRRHRRLPAAVAGGGAARRHGRRRLVVVRAAALVGACAPDPAQRAGTSVRAVPPIGLGCHPTLLHHRWRQEARHQTRPGGKRPTGDSHRGNHRRTPGAARRLVPRSRAVYMAPGGEPAGRHLHDRQPRDRSPHLLLGNATLWTPKPHLCVCRAASRRCKRRY